MDHFKVREYYKDPLTAITTVLVLQNNTHKK